MHFIGILQEIILLSIFFLQQVITYTVLQNKTCRHFNMQH